MTRCLFGGLLLVQVGTDRYGSVGIDGAVAFFDVADDAIFVDDDVGALRPLVGFLLRRRSPSGCRRW